MDKHADFIKHLRQVFLLELIEHTDTLEQHILQLDTLAQAEISNMLKQLFRTAHTLKGASRAAQYPQIEHIADNLETLFSSCSKDNIAPLLAQQHVLLHIVDQLKIIATAPIDSERAAATDDALMALGRQLIQPVTSTTAEAPQPPAPSSPIAAMPEASATPDAAPVEPTAATTIKVRSDVLNQLLNLNNDMLTAKRRVQSAHKQLQQWQYDHAVWLYSQQTGPMAELKQLLRNLKQEQRQLNQILTPLSERILQTGMAPFSLACQALQRIVHDVADETGKKVQLKLSGQNTELDRYIINSLKDPLLHLVRNAIDHGIEPPQQRLAANKAETGTLSIKAGLKHGGICITVADDGKGLDLRKIRAQLSGDEQHLSDNELIQKILQPGFTTTQHVTPLSGRGVGLDVVADTVHRLRGQVQINNKPGQGFEIQLHLPLNISVLFALQLRCADQVFFLDAQSVVNMLRIEKHQLLSLEGNWVLPQKQSTLPVFSLSALLGLPPPAWPEQLKLPLVHITDGQQHIGLLVDELTNQQQIAIKALGPRFKQSRLFSASALLEDGQVALILHSAGLIQQALKKISGTAHWKPASMAETEQKKRLLVADDSFTTRTLLKGILELEGFDITLAEDGLAAWQKVQREPFDLIVSDVEMPYMNGFELTATVRKSAQYQHLPIILVTALKTDEDKLKGMQAGANAYIVKSSFEQTELLKAINQLL